MALVRTSALPIVLLEATSPLTTGEEKKRPIKMIGNIKKSVLVVDNHPVMLRYMRKLLEKRGDRVLTAEDGLMALKILKTHTPDVIFIDQVMPNISGDKLSWIIRSKPKFNKTCIIVLSAIAAEDEFNLARFNANYCIAKGPFDKLSTHILALLYKLDAKEECGFSERIIGKEDIYFRQISKELLYSKRHAEAILNHMAEGIVELSPEREIVYINPAAIDMIGGSEIHLLGVDFLELFHGQDRQWVEELFVSISGGVTIAAEPPALTVNSRSIAMEILQIADVEHGAITVILNDTARMAMSQEQGGEVEFPESHALPAHQVAHDVKTSLQVGYYALRALEKYLKKEEGASEQLGHLKNTLDNIKKSIGHLHVSNHSDEKRK